MKWSLANAVLNSLSSHIAVLDDTGTIVAVNDAWTTFARENGGNDATSYLGENYLAACDGAPCGGGDSTAAAMRDGMRAMLQGQRDEFALEYPCSSPTQLRWFCVKVRRCRHEGTTYLIVAHDDITARKLAETQVREAGAAIDAANRELQQVLVREQRNARTDDLTGLGNRRHFFELVGPLFNVAQRYQTPLSIVLLDIDHFKRFNDRFGHHVGDTILQRIARIARRHSRDADVLARHGGEEFIIALPNTAVEGALALALSIREDIALNLECVDSTLADVTISAGVAQIRYESDSLDRLIHRADRALYQAKNAGRNCCRVFAQGNEGNGDGE